MISVECNILLLLIIACLETTFLSSHIERIEASGGVRGGSLFHGRLRLSASIGSILAPWLEYATHLDFLAIFYVRDRKIFLSSFEIAGLAL